MVAIPDKSAATTATTTLSMSRGRFGSCAEVVTDDAT